MYRIDLQKIVGFVKGNYEKNIQNAVEMGQEGSN